MLCGIWLRYYSTSRKTTDSSPDQVDFLIDIIFLAALWPLNQLSL
jgi:hypothetical protein